MAPKSKIIEELFGWLRKNEVPDIAQRWFESLNLSEAEKVEVLTPEYLKKLKNLGNEFPEGFRQYEPKVLHQVIDDSAKGYSDIAVMNPEDFRMLASRNIESQIQQEADWLAANPNEVIDDINTERLAKIDRYAEMFEGGELFDEVPWLSVQTNISPDIAQIIGHEGRHRERALRKLGADASLVRLIPSDNMSPENLSHALRNADKTMVSPMLPERVSKMDPKAVLHTELSSMQSGEQGGGKAYKPIGDVLKFLSLGALGGLYDGPE